MRFRDQREDTSPGSRSASNDHPQGDQAREKIVSDPFQLKDLNRQDAKFAKRKDWKRMQFDG